MLDFGVALWRFHSSRSRRNPWAALCPPSTHPQRSTSRNLRVFLAPKWNFTGIFPAETPGCFCWPSGSAWSPRSAARPPPLLPWDVPGREAGMRRAGNAERVGSCAHAGSRTSLLSSLLCPRSRSGWDGATASADSEFSRRDRGGEGRGKSGGLDTRKAFPFGMLSLTESQKSSRGSPRLSLTEFRLPRFRRPRGIAPCSGGNVESKPLFVPVPAFRAPSLFLKPPEVQGIPHSQRSPSRNYGP